MRMHRIVLLAAAGFAALALAAVAAVRICKSCGWEVGGEAATCAHCGAVAPASTAEAPAATPGPAAVETAAANSGSSGRIPEEVLKDQIAMAEQYFAKGSYWGAMLFARNAAAMLALKGRDGATNAVRMDQMIAECRKRLLSIEGPCPVCDGTGRPRMQAITLKGDVIKQEMIGGKCAICKGTGHIYAKPMADQLNREQADAQRTFALEERRRGLEESREIWLPTGLSDQLGARETSAVRKAFGVPCASCNGFRSSGCATCKGVGLLKCKNEGCVGGVEICADCKGKGRMSGSQGSNTITRRCESCNGTGKRSCPDCEGRGMMVCTACSGTGEKLCTKCKGSGQGDLCTKCQGDGIAPCSRCRGTGKYKDIACDICKGAGQVVCKSCLGAGRTSRR